MASFGVIKQKRPDHEWKALNKVLQKIREGKNGARTMKIKYRNRIVPAAS